MTRRVIKPKMSSSEEYLTLVTGGPTKYYNRRRVRKMFGSKPGRWQLTPITAEWFAEIVRSAVRARKQHHLTQIELASRLGTSQAAISRFESGQANPTVEFVDRLTRTLGLTIDLTIGN